MILKDKPQLTRTIDEIIYGVKNGYFTQIPTLTISDISWNDDETTKTNHSLQANDCNVPQQMLRESCVLKVKFISK